MEAMPRKSFKSLPALFFPPFSTLFFLFFTCDQGGGQEKRTEERWKSYDIIT